MSDPTSPHLGRLLELIGPVLSGLFRSTEVDQVSLIRRREIPGDSKEEFLLSITVHGEESRHYAWREGQAEERPEDFQRRLAGELQDFIAESRFARGTWRPWPPSGAADDQQ